jgi:transglutaminase-like putative cysteine protease
MFARLAALPRDARDTLFLLCVIAWVVLPQVSHLPLWCSLLAAGVLVWRASLALLARPLPGKAWLLGLLALTLAATLYTQHTLLGRDAGVTLIVVLLALKTLELRARRDAFVVFFLGFFTMLTNFFFSQSLLTAAAMLVALLGLLTALVNAHMVVGKPPLALALKTAGKMALLGAPIMAVLFVLFPRLSPLWGIPSDGMSGRSGLSSQMKVGAIARLVLDDNIAMRIKFNGPPPVQSELYFRGPVLSSFDGQEWRPLPPRAAYRLPNSELAVSGPAVSYEVTLEPHNRPWIFVLEAAAQAPKVPGYDVAMSADLQWLASRPVTDLVRYSAVSYPNFRHGPTRASGNAAIGLQDDLDLPPGYNPRTLQLAQDLRRDPQLARANTATLVAAVLERLRTGGYRYTLEPGTTGQHSADEFWFDSKLGFCEHIASAFVVLMRAMDVPARIVTGYQGGERNAVDGFWVVRQSDAHAWAEVWHAGTGWVRVDPTAAVAPSRIGAFQRLQAPTSAIAGAVGAIISPSMVEQMRQAWEAVNNGWNQWVLNYTQSRQLNLLKNIGFASPSWEDLGYVLIGIVVLSSLVGAAWTLWERSQHDPWLRLLAQARQRLHAAGLVAPPQTPPRELARLLRLQWGDAAAVPAWQQWLLRLEGLRYAPDSAPGTTPTSHRARLATLRHEFKQLAALQPHPHAQTPCPA